MLYFQAGLAPRLCSVVLRRKMSEQAVRDAKEKNLLVGRCCRCDSILFSAWYNVTCCAE